MTEMPMHISHVMAEYLDNLEALCAAVNNPERSSILTSTHATYTA